MIVLIDVKDDEEMFLFSLQFPLTCILTTSHGASYFLKSCFVWDGNSWSSCFYSGLIMQSNGILFFHQIIASWIKIFDAESKKAHTEIALKFQKNLVGSLVLKFWFTDKQH